MILSGKYEYATPPIGLICYNFNNMFKKLMAVTLAPSSEHDIYPYGSPWVTAAAKEAEKKRERGENSVM